MTTAQTGLAAALARSASGSVMALAEMAPADILASLSDEQRTALAATLAPQAAAEGMPPKKENCSEDGDEDDKDGDSDPGMKGKDKAEASQGDAFAQVNARFQTVLASDDYKGREQLAHTLLGNASLSADAILAALAAAPSPTVNAGTADDAALAEMRAALASTGNSKIDANAPAPGAAAKAASVWDTALAKVSPNSAK